MTITGISPTVATTLAHLGIALDEVATDRSRQRVLTSSARASLELPREDMKSFLALMRADPHLDIETQQRRLFQLILIAMLAGGAVIAPLFLVGVGWPLGGVLVAAQLIAAGFAAVALFQLRKARLQPAILLTALGFVFALAVVLFAFGLRASTALLPIAFFPLAWVALLGTPRSAWATLGIAILAVSGAALEGNGLPWVGFLAAPELPTFLTVIIFTVAGIILGWFLMQSGQTLRTALDRSHQREAELAVLRDSLETTVALRTESLQQALTAVQAREAQLAQTLAELHTSQETIRKLSAPVIPALPGTLVLPLVGTLDSARAATMAEQVLSAVEQRRARIVIIDMTGLSMVDTHVVQALLSTAAAVQLLGARVIAVGIRPEVAQTMVALQITMGSITTYTDLQEAVLTTLCESGWRHVDQEQPGVR